MNLIGICGDHCEFCPRYIATKSGKRVDLERVKELWIRLGFIDNDFSVEDMDCQGCLPKNGCAYTELCECVRAKSIENCGLCDDYPCKRINMVFDQSEKLRSRANQVCTREEMALLNKAFFSKKEYFDRIHRCR